MKSLIFYLLVYNWLGERLAPEKKYIVTLDENESGQNGFWSKMCCKSRVTEVIDVTLEVHAKGHHRCVICSFARLFVWRFHVHSQELSKIAMPVVFNEPLSFLQRMSEYMEHTHLIHKACSTSDSIDRMQVGIRCECFV